MILIKLYNIWIIILIKFLRMPMSIAPEFRVIRLARVMHVKDVQIKVLVPQGRESYRLIMRI